MELSEEPAHQGGVLWDSRAETLGKFHWGALGCHSLRWTLSSTTKHYSLGFSILVGKVQERVCLCAGVSVLISVWGCAGLLGIVYNPQNDHIGSRC